MKALSFGEILWDVFGEERTLGGAPLNVLGHIRRLGGDSGIISAVGDDELGHLTVERIDELGIDRRYLRISPYPTGRAVVTLSDGIPSYSFDEPSAWDDITLPQSDMKRISSSRCSVFIYGTLAQRSPVSRKTLWSLLDSVEADEFFFDVNLRLSFWDEAGVRKGLERATILKMNDEEVPRIASLLSMDKSDLAAGIMREYPVRRIIVTLGKHGSVCYENGKEYRVPSGDVKVVDTVGAGDSLSAAFLYFISSGLSSGEALARASLLADYVVSRRGAIPEYDDAIRKRLML